MTANEMRGFIFENYYKRIGFPKENIYHSMQRQRKRSAVVCNQINRKKDLILVML